MSNRRANTIHKKTFVYLIFIHTCPRLNSFTLPVSKLKTQHCFSTVVTQPCTSCHGQEYERMIKLLHTVVAPPICTAGHLTASPKVSGLKRDNISPLRSGGKRLRSGLFRVPGKLALKRSDSGARHRSPNPNAPRLLGYVLAQLTCARAFNDFITRVADGAGSKADADPARMQHW